jgi:acyl-CoA reductase-like NAD-dependent aldehyde dehydrogenase
VTPPDLTTTLDRLVAGSATFTGTDHRDRAALARRSALAIVATADAWADAAVMIKGAIAAPASALAEEMATGPMATIRLCLLHARAEEDIAREGRPIPAAAPRLLHPDRPAGGTPAPLVGIDVLPARGPFGSLHDGTIFGGVKATVRCLDPGGLEAFDRSWRREVEERPRTGGVAVVLGAGNVTGLAPADALAQIFEHGRAVLLKLHPLHEPLEPVLRAALAPLIDAGLLAIVSGGADTARAAIDAPQVTHVHVTGGQATYEAILWGGPRPADAHAKPALGKSITCELGNVTPWFVLPGRYSRAALSFQADQIAASIANNTSFNCIATKVIVTCRAWDQRSEFLALVRRRLESLPARPAWYPAATRTWEEATGRSAPADGTLPWWIAADVDPGADDRLLRREWFVPVVADVPLAAASLAEFAGRVLEFAHRLPGSLAAAVTVPEGLSAADRLHAEQVVDHLAFGVVAVNGWSALAYALGNVPWGGFPGGTLREPRSGLGFVHDPLLLPLVHNSVIRSPLAAVLRPAWFPWHRGGARLARGVVDLYGQCARGRASPWTLVRMLPDVLRG